MKNDLFVSFLQRLNLFFDYVIFTHEYYFYWLIVHVIVNPVMITALCTIKIALLFYCV